MPEAGERIKRRWTTEMQERLRKLSIFQGSHSQDEKKQCIMEAVAVITDQPFTDYPVCVSGVLTGYLQEINDTLASNSARGRLKRVVPRLIGTAPAVWKYERVYNHVSDGWGFQLMQRTDVEDADYQQVERDRDRLITEFVNNEGGDTLTQLDVPLRDKLAVIERAAALRYFNE